MKKGQKPSRHIRRVRTRKGKRKVVVNRKIKKKPKHKKNYGSSPKPKGIDMLVRDFEKYKDYPIGSKEYKNLKRNAERAYVSAREHRDSKRVMETAGMLSYFSKRPKYDLFSSIPIVVWRKQLMPQKEIEDYRKAREYYESDRRFFAKLRKDVDRNKNPRLWGLLKNEEQKRSKFRKINTNLFRLGCAKRRMIKELVRLEAKMGQDELKKKGMFTK